MITSMRSHSSSLACVVVAVTLTACASSPQQRPIEQRALADIKAVDTLYLKTLAAAGDLHRAHKLDDTAYARVLTTAEAVRVVREATVSALLEYLSVAPTDDRVGALRAALDTTLARLVANAVQLKAVSP